MGMGCKSRPHIRELIDCKMVKFTDVIMNDNRPIVPNRSLNCFFVSCCVDPLQIHKNLVNIFE